MDRKTTWLLLSCVLALLCAATVFGATTATGTGSSDPMPWEGPISQILASLTGPVAKAFGILAIMGAGWALARSEGGSVMQKVFSVVFGLSIVFGAATWGDKLFNFGGGIGF